MHHQGQRARSILIALLGVFFLREDQTPLQWMGIVVAITGAVMYFHPAGFPAGQYAGVIVSAIGVAANAGAAILGRSTNRSGEVSPITITMITITIGAAVHLPIGIATQGLPRVSLTGWLTILWLAAVNTAAAFTLWNYTLQSLSAAESGIINGTMSRSAGGSSAPRSPADPEATGGRFRDVSTPDQPTPESRGRHQSSR